MATKTLIPEWMRFKEGERESNSVYYIPFNNHRLDEPTILSSVNKTIARALAEIKNLELKPPVLLKVHIGEPRNVTRLQPEMMAGCLDFLIERGVTEYFFGDTTVIYSGTRGDRSNDAEAKPYLQLAEKHGWTGSAPYVVLDRPQTGAVAGLKFEEAEIVSEIATGGRFKRFYRSGGFEAAGSIINHVHLTLHLLSGFALSIKGLAMGLSGRSGKTMMHRHLHPQFSAGDCILCGICADTCPEEAIDLRDERQLPEVDKSKCVGCGECEVACEEGAITMIRETVTDWEKGADTLHTRMIDYLIGLMHGRWNGLVNVAHLYNITKLCDCVDQEQQPICGDIGILIGRNPFAVDYAARQLLEKKLAEEGGETIGGFHESDSGYTIFDYAAEKFGIITKPEIIELKIRS